MTARVVFQVQTGTCAQLVSAPSSSVPFGTWEPGLALTPIEFIPDLTGGVSEFEVEAPLDIVWEPIAPRAHEEEETSPEVISGVQDPLLRELWDNPDDAEYDEPDPR